MAVMPVKYSPDSLFFQGIDQMTQSDNSFVKHAAARATQLVAIPAIIAVSLLYNAVAITVKTPFLALRYTIGFIPTEKGRLADKFPEDTTATHFAWHAYKILVFWLDALPLYPIGLISPSTNVLVHRKLLLIPGIQDLKNSLEQALSDIEQGSKLETSVLEEKLPLSHSGSDHATPFEKALKQKAEEMRANQAKAETSVEPKKTEKGQSAKRPGFLQGTDFATELQQKIGARKKESLDFQDPLLKYPTNAKNKKVNKLLQGMMDNPLIARVQNQHGSKEDYSVNSDSQDEWEISPSDEDEWNDTAATSSEERLSNDIGSILHPTPSPSYFPSEVTEDLPPMQLVTPDIANSEHYKKMARFHEMNKEEESDDESWDSASDID